MVIDACRMAGHKHQIALVLIGDGRDQAKIVRHIAGDPHVQLLAPIADRALLASVMASADALIHGCEAETFGLVAAEAAASGLPSCQHGQRLRCHLQARARRALWWSFSASVWLW